MNRLSEFIIEKLEEATGIDEITEDSALFDEEILDSLSILYLVTEIETEYRVQIPLEEVTESHFSTVNRIVEYLNEKM